MLDKRFIRDHPDEVKAAVRVKGINLDVDELLDLDTESRRLQTEVDRAQALRKSSSKEHARADEAHRAELKIEHENLEPQLKSLRDQLSEPNETLHAPLPLT